MKIVASYLSSLYEKKETIDMINNTSADGIHVDLMDGIYAGVNNFTIPELNEIFKDNTKPLDVHMMIASPLDYIDDIIRLNPDCIYFHPKTVPGLISTLNNLKANAIKRGIAINPDEDILKFIHYFPYVDRILLMSVVPGKGGQEFILSTVDKIKELLKHKKDYNFEIYIDGGVNDETIKNILDVDGVVVGSFICKNPNFETQIQKLKKYVERF